MPQYVIQLSFVYHLSQALLWPSYRSATLYSKHYIRYNTQKQSIVCTKSRVSYSCLTNVINLLGICIYIDGVCYISEWSKLYIWATATHPEDACHIYCRMFISGRWRLHIWTSFTYLDDECYIFGRHLHIWIVTKTPYRSCNVTGFAMIDTSSHSLRFLAYNFWWAIVASHHRYTFLWC